MRKNTAHRGFTAKVIAVGVVLGVMVAGAWAEIGLGCDYKPEWCGNITFDKVDTTASGDTTWAHSSNPVPRCIFITGSTGYMNFGNADADYPNLLNGVHPGGSSNTGYLHDYEFNALPKQDGGYYIFMPGINHYEFKGMVAGTPKCTTPVYKLKIARDGTGKGTIVPDTGTYSILHDSDTSITVTLEPHNTVSWDGCDSISTPDGLTCYITKLKKDTTVTATFHPPVELSLKRAGNGTGTLSIDTGTTLRTQDTTLSITATPAANTTVSWTGCTSTNADSTICHVTMNESKDIIATFYRPLILTIADSGWGEGTTDPAIGIPHSYARGSDIAIAVTPEAGNTVEWRGCTPNTNNDTCYINNITSDKKVTVVFTPPTYAIPAGYLAWNTQDGPVITAGDGKWGDANWSAGNPLSRDIWETGKNAYFGGKDTPARTVEVNAAATVDTMKFANSGYTIGGSSTLTMAHGNIIVAADKTAAISTVLAGIEGMTLSGGGDLILSGNNTYTGITRVTAGNLQIGDGGTTGQVKGDILVSDGCKIIFNRSNDTTLAAAISGSGGFTKLGDGTLTLTGSNIYTGPTAINAGTLIAQWNGTTELMTLPVASAVTVSNSAVLRYTTSETVTYGGNITVKDGAVLEFNNTAASAEYSGTINAAAISNTGRIEKTGDGTLTLSGSKTTKILNITKGTLNVANELTADSVIVNGGTLNLRAGANIQGQVEVLAGGTVSVSDTTSSFSDLTMKSEGSTIKWNGNFLKTETLTLNGKLDVTLSTFDVNDSFKIISYVSLTPSMFDTIVVNNKIAARYNNKNELVYQADFDESADFKFFKIDTADNTIKLVVSDIKDVAGDVPNNPLEIIASQPDRRKDSVAITVRDIDDPNERLYTTAGKIEVTFSWNKDMSSPFEEKTINLAEAGKFDSTKFNLAKLDKFAQEQCSVYWQITIYDTTGVAGSEIKTGAFAVGRPRPAELQNFRAAAKGPDSVRISWNRIALPAANGSLDTNSAYIVIRQSPTAITLAADTLPRNDYNIILRASDASVVNSGSPANTNLNVNRVDSNTITIGGFTAETRYWFAGAVMDSSASVNGRWNLISKAVLRDTLTTVDNPGQLIENILKIDEIDYEADGHNFVVTFSITKPNTDSVMYGYCISVDTACTPHSPDSIRVTTIGSQWRTNGWSAGTGILFDTTWYVVAAAHKDGYWSDERVIDSLKVGPFNKQPVVVGNPTRGEGYANNSRFRINAYKWHTTEADSTFNADIEKSDIGYTNFKDDFIFISGGYRLSNVRNASATRLESVSFSIKADTDSIKTPYSINDVRLYKWNAAGCGGSGCWNVEFNSKINNPDLGWITVDSVRADTAGTGTIYRLMIDRQKPRLFAKENGQQQDSGFVRLNSFNFTDKDGQGFLGIIDTFFVQKTNVDNFTAVLRYARADNAPFDSMRTAAVNISAASNNLRRFVFTIRKTDIEAMSLDLNSLGIRAFLVISDGRHIDTVNVSRSVSYNKYPNLFAASIPNSWVPVAAKAILKNKRVEDAMAPLFTEEYDVTQHRIFRYEENKWVEYTENEELFSLEQGRLFWLKTADPKPLLFDTEAQSPSLIDPYTITIKPKQWADFVLPFSFDVCLGDILDALNENQIDSLEIYKWAENNRRYRAQRIFLGGVDNKEDRDNVWSLTIRGADDPLTVYNSGNTPVTLRIMPKLASMSKYGNAEAISKVAAKSGNSQMWYYTINTRVGSDIISSVLAGYNTAQREYSVPPSFGGESVVLIGDKGNEMGHFFTSDFASGGRAFKLRFTNSQKQKTVFTFSAQQSAFAPANTQVMFVNAVTGETINGKNEYTINVDASSHEDVYMIVGSKDYLAKTAISTNMKFTIGNILVNQASRSARIKYYIPFAGVERVEVTAFDLKGRVVWKNAQKARAASWNTMEWNSRNSMRSTRGAAAAGLYIVRVKAINAKGKTVAVANKRLTFNP